MFFHSLNDFFGRDNFQSVSEGAAPAEENRAELNGGSELNAVGAAVDNDGFFSELIIDDIQQVGIYDFGRAFLLTGSSVTWTSSMRSMR